MKIALISVFGVLGVLTRYSFDFLWGDRIQTLPLTTMAVNLIGCFIAGFIYAININKIIIPEYLVLPILIGFCGGLTTFSGYILQALNLVQNGQILKACFYLTISIFLGLLTVHLGVKVAHWAS